MAEKWKFLDLEQLFRDSLVWGRPVLEKGLGERGAAGVIAAAGEEYADLRPGVPVPVTLGGRINLAAAVIVLPMYRALQKEMDSGQALGLACDFNEACLTGSFSRFPALVKRAMKIPLVVRAGVRLMAWQDNRADDPHGWRYEMLPTRPGHLMDFDVTRCGVHKYLSERGAPELTRRAICPLDDVMARRFLPAGTRLVRTRFLSEGGECCDFRFVSRGGEG